MVKESTPLAVRYVVTPNSAPYAGKQNPREALQAALDDFYLGDPSLGEVGRGMYWLTSNVLEAKVTPYEKD